MSAIVELCSLLTPFILMDHVKMSSLHAKRQNKFSMYLLTLNLNFHFICLDIFSQSTNQGVFFTSDNYSFTKI